MNRNMDKLDYLLSKWSYEDLQLEDRHWVNEHYSVSAYNALRAALVNSQETLASQKTKPNPEIKSRLRQQFKQHHRAERPAAFLAYRIPAWQAVAAIALLLFFLPQLRTNPESNTEQIFIYQTDTVFKEIPVSAIFNPIIDTISSIPKVRKVLNRTNRSPIKSSTVVFSKDAAIGAGLSRSFAQQQGSDYDTASVENIISRYLKDSVKNYRVAIDTGFQDMGRIY